MDQFPRNFWVNVRYEISNKTLVFDNQGFKLKKERLNYIKVFSKLVLPNRLWVMWYVCMFHVIDYGILFYDHLHFYSFFDMICR